MNEVIIMAETPGQTVERIDTDVIDYIYNKQMFINKDDKAQS